MDTQLHPRITMGCNYSFILKLSSSLWANDYMGSASDIRPYNNWTISIIGQSGNHNHVPQAAYHAINIYKLSGWYPSYPHLWHTLRPPSILHWIHHWCVRHNHNPKSYDDPVQNVVFNSFRPRAPIRYQDIVWTNLLSSFNCGQLIAFTARSVIVNAGTFNYIP